TPRVGGADVPGMNRGANWDRPSPLPRQVRWREHRGWAPVVPTTVDIGPQRTSNSRLAFFIRAWWSSLDFPPGATIRQWRKPCSRATLRPWSMDAQMEYTEPCTASVGRAAMVAAR